MVPTKLHVSTFTAVASYIIFFCYPQFVNFFSYHVLRFTVYYQIWSTPFLQFQRAKKSDAV